MSTGLIPCQRDLFDIPADVAYFNCAYMSPLMRSVVAAGEAGVRHKARPWLIEPRDFFTESEHARSLFARLIGAGADDVALVAAASYGVAVAARGVEVGPGQRILLLDEQFPSNVYAWQEKARESGAEVLTVPRPRDADWTRAVLEVLDERVAVAALPNCHWTDGALVDLVRVAERCREVGAALVLDVTQSAGALPFEVAEIRPDYAVAACYKWLLGPYSMGFLYVAPERWDGPQLEHNWIAREGAEDFAGLVRYTDRRQPGARRYDVGERANFALVPMAAAALEQILAWDTQVIASTLRVRTAGIAERARSLGFESLDDERRAGHFLGLRIPRGQPAALAERLAASRVHVSVRGDSVRVTPHLYNTDEDVQRLLGVLETAV